MICTYQAMRIGSSWGNEIHGHVDDLIYEYSNKKCTFCFGLLETKNAGKKYAGLGNYYSIDVILCNKCGWWHVLWEYVDTNNDEHSANHFFGNVKHYDPSSLDVPIIKLRKYLQKNRTTYQKQIHMSLKN